MTQNHARAIELLSHIDVNAANQLRQAFDKAAWHPEFMRVGVLGLYNAGKSTTLNALVDDVTCTTFISGDVPTTKKIQCLRYNGMELMDTPGLDVDPEDDANAFAGLQHCDVILLVHSLSNGELDRTSLEALKKLDDEDPQPLAKRLIAVWTCASEVALEEETKLAEKLTTQLRTTTGGHPKQVSVDNVTYFKALQNGKTRLKAHSGIPALKQQIADLCATKINVRKAREARRLHQLSQGLEVVRMATNALAWQQELKRGQLVKRIQQPLESLSTHRQRLMRLTNLS